MHIFFLQVDTMEHPSFQIMIESNKTSPWVLVMSPKMLSMKSLYLFGAIISQVGYMTRRFCPVIIIVVDVFDMIHLLSSFVLTESSCGAHVPHSSAKPIQMKSTPWHTPSQYRFSPGMVCTCICWFTLALSYRLWLNFNRMLNISHILGLAWILKC